MDRFEKYGRIEAWARDRYKRPDGSWIRCVGNGVAEMPGAPSSNIPFGNAYMVPSRYSVIEDMAAARYLGTRRHFPAFTIATAYHEARSAEGQR